jgi:RNA polymerase sigma-70 factor (ECF subfamily)
MGFSLSNRLVSGTALNLSADSKKSRHKLYWQDMALEGAQERDLLARARAGDRQAQAELYEQYIYHAPAIRGLLRRAVQSEAEREDLLQEIFLAVIRSAGEFRGDSRLSTYLFRVAQLTVLESFRAANTQKRGGHIRLVAESDWSENPAQEPRSTPLEFEEIDLRLAMDKLMEQVPEAYREALRLRLFEELDYQQIAERLSIPLNTVATRIFKGKAVLVELLRKAGFRCP